MPKLHKNIIHLKEKTYRKEFRQIMQKCQNCINIIEENFFISTLPQFPSLFLLLHVIQNLLSGCPRQSWKRVSLVQWVFVWLKRRVSDWKHSMSHRTSLGNEFAFTNSSINWRCSHKKGCNHAQMGAMLRNNKSETCREKHSVMVKFDGSVSLAKRHDSNQLSDISCSEPT